MKKPERGSLWRDNGGEVYLLVMCGWNSKRPEGKRDRYVAVGIASGNRWRDPKSDTAQAVAGLKRVKGTLEFKEEVKP